MEPMDRFGRGRPLGPPAGVAPPKLNVFHIPPPESATITCAASDGLTSRPLTRPASMAGYCTAFHSKAAVDGPTLTQEGAVTRESGAMPGAAGISEAQRTDSWWAISA